MKSKKSAAVEVTTAPNTATEPPLANDLVWGAEAIGAEIGVGPRRAFHILQSGTVPAKKVGALWVASRAALRRHFTE
jgi:hypothetical protein